MSRAPFVRRPASTALVAVAAAVAAATVTACGAGDAPAEAASADLLLTDVRVVDVDAGTVVGERNVAVADGRISGIWTAEETPAGLEAERTVAGEGRWLIPGLWDAHVHFRGGEAILEENRALLPLFPAKGVTTIRDAGGDLTDHLMAWRDSILAGDMAGPRILTSGPKLDGPDPSWGGSIALAGPEEVPAALDSLEALGVDYVKIYDGSMSSEVYMAIVEEAEERGLPVTGHMPLGVDYLEAVEAGLDGTEHLYYAFKGTAPNREDVGRRVRAGELGFWQAFWEMMDERDPALEAEAWDLMAERGTAVTPTLHIGDVLARVELEDHSDDPGLRYVAPAIRETYRGRVESAERSPAEVRERTRELRAMMADLVEPMHDAGVTILAGSDAGPFNSFVYPGFSLHRELQALVAAGLSPAEALRSATTAPADWMGLGDELGRVATGYRADLVLLDADPLADIANTETVSTVILRGDEVLDRAALEALLAEAEAGAGTGATDGG